jgi:hypothetical protein
LLGAQDAQRAGQLPKAEQPAAKSMLHEVGMSAKRKMQSKRSVASPKANVEFAKGFTSSAFRTAVSFESYRGRVPTRAMYLPSFQIASLLHCRADGPPYTPPLRSACAGRTTSSEPFVSPSARTNEMQCPWECSAAVSAQLHHLAVLFGPFRRALWPRTFLQIRCFAPVRREREKLVRSALRMTEGLVRPPRAQIATCRTSSLQHLQESADARCDFRAVRFSAPALGSPR